MAVSSLDIDFYESEDPIWNPALMAMPPPFNGFIELNKALAELKKIRSGDGDASLIKHWSRELSFNAAFNQQDWGVGAAIAFILFVIIVTLTLLQRWVLRDKDTTTGRRARKAQAAEAER